MFVFLSKLLDLAFTPLAWSLLLGALSLALRRRFPNPALGLGVLGLVVLYLFSTFPVAGAITRHVEQGVLSSRAEGVVYDAVVVLGGMTEPGPSALAGSPQYGEAIERMLVGYAEVASGGSRHLIISGGLIEDDPEIPREAVTVGRPCASWASPRTRSSSRTAAATPARTRSTPPRSCASEASSGSSWSPAPST